MMSVILILYILCLFVVLAFLEKLGGKGGILEYSQAAKFAEQLFNVYDTFHSTGGREKSKKRKVFLCNS